MEERTGPKQDPGNMAVNSHWIQKQQTDGNRKVTKTLGRPQPYSDHPINPQRFGYKPQVVCTESVCERCYWKAEFSVSEGGEVSIAVTYEGISQKGGGYDTEFGWNKNTWSLWCGTHGYYVYHNKNATRLPTTPSTYRRVGACDGGGGEGVCVYRVGVCVDRLAGTLSFYTISDSATLTLLHRFHTHFSEHTPLCARFGVFGYNNSVSLCQLE